MALTQRLLAVETMAAYIPGSYSWAGTSLDVNLACGAAPRLPLMSSIGRRCRNRKPRRPNGSRDL